MNDVSLDHNCNSSPLLALNLFSQLMIITVDQHHLSTRTIYRPAPSIDQHHLWPASSSVSMIYQSAFQLFDTVCRSYTVLCCLLIIWFDVHTMTKGQSVATNEQHIQNPIEPTRWFFPPTVTTSHFVASIETIWIYCIVQFFFTYCVVELRFYYQHHRI